MHRSISREAQPRGTMEASHTLNNGERLDITVLGPGEGRGDTVSNRELWWFIIQPFNPWTSPAENELVARVLCGAADDSLHDYLFIGRINDEVVGTVWHGTSSNTHEMGGYGFVRTDPEHRGKGVAQALTKLSVEQFWADGGRAMYLGTVAPDAAHVYEKFGYRRYNGIAMRALRPGLDPEGFEDEHFAHDGAPLARDATLGDIGSYPALTLSSAPKDWLIRDFTEGMFYYPPDIFASSCLRPFISSVLRREANPANQFKMLVSRRDRVVASANLFVPQAAALHGEATLEFQCYPTYRGELSSFLGAVLVDGREAGIRRVRAHAASDGRGAALAEIGFKMESVLAGYLQVGDQAVDVSVMRRDLA